MEVGGCDGGRWWRMLDVCVGGEWWRWVGVEGG